MWFEGCKRGRLHLIFVFLLSLLQALSSNGLSMGFRDLVLWCRWQITFWKTRSLWRHQERSACDETTMWRYIEPNKFYEEFNSWLSTSQTNRILFHFAWDQRRIQHLSVLNLRDIPGKREVQAAWGGLGISEVRTEEKVIKFGSWWPTVLALFPPQIDQNRSKRIKQMQLLSDNIDT